MVNMIRCAICIRLFVETEILMRPTRKRFRANSLFGSRPVLYDAYRTVCSDYVYYNVYEENGLARSISAPNLGRVAELGPSDPPILSSSDLFSTTQLLATLSQTPNSHLFIGRNQGNNSLLVVKLIDGSSKAGRTTINNELRYLKTNTKHPNLIEYYGQRTINQITMIYQEYFHSVDLFTLLQQCKRLASPIISKIFKQLVSAISYLHKQRICHLDIKLENILINKHSQIKITDFGMAQIALKNGQVEAYGGSLYYAAPEAITGGIYNGFLADAWSCGIVVFVLANGYFPKQANRSIHLPNTPAFVKQATNYLLEIDPGKRSPISRFQSEHKKIQ
ncbi:BR serine/threonine kinase [Nematocida homosporus]|uniref:BR serine/threonine kinase n=1 Tax=Nematocida homosporus TaxID=1912981 RepID=UPI0022208E3A|nr:BR serine/threonine kinase [Nematocida homosporus]KAI5186526.1 BR serine/threonine kinase [Nematocida homosporus]